MSEPAEHRRYTLDAQITCVRRELAMRKNVYPKWTQSGRMKPETANHEINCMQAVHDTLSAIEAAVAEASIGWGEAANRAYEAGRAESRIEERARCAARIRLQGQLNPENGGNFELLAEAIERGDEPGAG